MEKNEALNWTHEKFTITDIRRVQNLYIISINDKKINAPLFINYKIFDDRLRSYFLKEPKEISREEILGVEWDMYISKGYYIKVSQLTGIEKHEGDPSKFYVSFLEISGPLSTFESIYKSK